MQDYRRYTRSFALTVFDLLQFATIRAVADYLHVGWDMIKEIHKLKLSRPYQKQNLTNLTYLGIDGFPQCQGRSPIHDYLYGSANKPHYSRDRGQVL